PGPADQLYTTFWITMSRERSPAQAHQVRRRDLRSQNRASSHFSTILNNVPKASPRSDEAAELSPRRAAMSAEARAAAGSPRRAEMAREAAQAQPQRMTHAPRASTPAA